MDNNHGNKHACYGCKHYKRKCALYSPCCGKVYKCRLCHDDGEDHVLDRRRVEVVQCSVCQLLQAVKKQCTRCSTEFGKYYCEACRLYDDDLEKDIFHCEDCGLCRLGGVNNFFHCATCDMCINIHLEEGGHKCVQQVSRRNCPVCEKDLHSSTTPLKSGKCGHLVHSTCIQELRNKGITKCKQCNNDFF